MCKHVGNCTRSDAFALDDGIYRYCTKHAPEGSKRNPDTVCIHPGCDYLPSFANIGKKAMYCATHKPDKHLPFHLKTYYNVSKKCESERCIRDSTFGTVEKHPVRCQEHRQRGDRDVKNPHFPCSQCGLPFRYLKTFEGQDYCPYCNPNPSKRQKTKELRIKELFDKHNLDYIHDKACNMNSSCRRLRPDFLFDCGSYFVIVEVDENAHNGYPEKCEEARMNDIVLNLGLECVFIRYNPDNKNYTDKEKESHLLDKVIHHLLNKSDGNVVEKLFYPNKGDSDMEGEMESISSSSESESESVECIGKGKGRAAVW